MNSSNPVDVTRLIEDAQAGNHDAAGQLFVLVLDELKRIAESKIKGEKAGITLQATALVNEVWLKLIGDHENVRFGSRGHFFVSAAAAMRQILVDAARARKAIKRGGGMVRNNIDGLQLAGLPPDEKLLDLQEALCRFEELFPVKAKVVTLRYFAGMTIADTAEALSISTATAERHWAFSRAWLKRELSDTSSD